MKRKELDKIVSKSVDKVFRKHLNESMVSKVSSVSSSDLEKEVDKEMLHKYSVILYWEASICDEVFAYSEKEAIEIALAKNKETVDKANKYVDLYDSDVGTCPEHRADLDD